MNKGFIIALLSDIIYINIMYKWRYFMSILSNDDFHRLNLIIDKQLIQDLDKLVKLSVRYKSRTQLIQSVLQDYVDTIKIYNSNLESNKE